MKRCLAIVTKNGQITLPAELREAWNLQEGDQIAIAVDQPWRQRAAFWPARSNAELVAGSMPASVRPLDLKEARRLYMEDVAQEVAAEGLPAAPRPKRSVQ